ncbi:MAG TPA: CDP-diacylglycerol--serine O-phosphatidyltransferase [Xanthobacteraceae bacterium]|nr:CDP-diacylglycerol--serine O-phosphatidyltransferase [Xanthobacteraceae bacterium]
MSNLFAPFDPDNEEPRRRRFKPVPVRRLLPNLVTLLSLCLGLTAIRVAVEGKFELAIAAIVVAAILDGLDGRIARFLQSTSRFGAELDSLADFVNFGVAPAIVLYFWGLSSLRSAGWIAALVFAICTSLRLARFNVMLDDPNKPPYAGNFFVGVPAPAGALIVMLPVYLELVGLPRTGVSPAFALVYTIGIALLMVSSLPTWSGKRVSARVPRDYVLPIFVLVVLLVALLVSYPWELLTAGSLAYLACIPLAYMHYQRLERAHLAAASGGMLHDGADAEEVDRPNRLN